MANKGLILVNAFLLKYRRAVIDESIYLNEANDQFENWNYDWLVVYILEGVPKGNFAGFCLWLN